MVTNRTTPLIVGLLKTAQELLAARVEQAVDIFEAGINAARVALPDIDDRAGERHAGAAVDARDPQGQIQPCAVFDRAVRRIRADVSAAEFFVDEIRPFHLLGAHDAGRCRIGFRGSRRTLWFALRLPVWMAGADQYGGGAHKLEQFATMKRMPHCGFICRISLHLSAFDD